MFTRMLVPLDGSLQAEQALPVAVQVARALDGTLILARVAQPQGVESGTLLERADEVTEYLAQLVRRPELAGIMHETVRLVGYPAEMLLDAIRLYQADSVILCGHGRTGLLRWVLGSVAQRIVHHAPVPVLLLHQQGPTLAAEDQRALRALVPLDGSGLAEAALRPAATLVSALTPQGQGILHLVQVIPFPPVGSEAGASLSTETRAREAALREAQDYLGRISEQLRREPFAQPSVQITWSALADQDVAGALVHLATTQAAGDPGGFDLIAMATHGHGGLQRWVMGSVTERVLSVSKLPLLVVRPQKEAILD